MDAVLTEDKKEQQQRGYRFQCRKYGQYKAQCRRLRKDGYCATKTNTANTHKVDAQKPKCETCGKMHKTENCWNGANAAIDPRKKIREFAMTTEKINEQPVPKTQPKN